MKSVLEIFKIILRTSTGNYFFRKHMFGTLNSKSYSNKSKQSVYLKEYFWIKKLIYTIVHNLIYFSKLHIG